MSPSYKKPYPGKQRQWQLRPADCRSLPGKLSAQYSSPKSSRGFSFQTSPALCCWKMPTVCTWLEDRVLTLKQGSQKLHTEVAPPHFPPTPTTLRLQFCYVLRVSGACLPLLCLSETYEPGTSFLIPASLIVDFFFFESYLKVSSSVKYFISMLWLSWGPFTRYFIFPTCPAQDEMAFPGLLCLRPGN